MLVTALLAAVTTAQANPLSTTPPSGGESGAGFYAAPVTRLTGADGQIALMAGARVGWVIHHSLVVGAQGMSMVSPTIWHKDSQHVMAMNYGSLFLEGVLGAGNRASAAFDLTWGYGEAHYRMSNDRMDISAVSGIFTVEGQVSVVMQIDSWVQLRFGPGYRQVLAADLDGVGNQALSGPYGELGITFGVF